MGEYTARKNRADNTDIKRELIKIPVQRGDFTKKFASLDIELYNVRFLIFLWERSGRNFKVYDKKVCEFSPFYESLGSAGARFSMRFLI